MGPSLKVKLVPLDVRDADEIERRLAAFTAEGNGGLIVSPNAVTFTNRDLIVRLAARLRHRCDIAQLLATVQRAAVCQFCISSV